MTLGLLDRLESRFENLIVALDGQDADAIIEAAAAIRPVVNEVENTGAWHGGTEINKRLLELSKLIDASKYRVNMLTDLNRQRAENLTLAAGFDTPSIYRKPL